MKIYFHGCSGTSCICNSKTLRKRGFLHPLLSTFRDLKVSTSIMPYSGWSGRTLKTFFRLPIQLVHLTLMWNLSARPYLGKYLWDKGTQMMDLTDGLLSSCPIFLSSFFPCMVLSLYKVKDLQLCVSHSCDVCRGRLLPTQVLKSYIIWMRLTYLTGCTSLKKDLVFDFSVHGYFRMLVP